MEKEKSKKININYVLENYFYLIITIFIPLLFSIIFFFLVKPVYDSVKTDADFLIETQNKYNYIKYDQLKKIRELRKDLESISSEDLVKLNQILPDNKNIEDLIINFENIANKANLQINSVGIDNNIENDDNQKVNKINISLNLKTNDVEKVKEFLTNIEKNIRLEDVNSLYIQQGSNSIINLSAYYKK
jgi:hypothetical protein